MPRNTFKIATISGINLYIHWSWLIIFGLLTWSLGGFYYDHFASWNAGTAYIVSAISAILLFVTVLLHELAHAITARSRGLPVNTITLYIFGGVASLTQEPRDPRTELGVALAGPLTSLVLAGVCFGLFAIAGGAPTQVQAVLHYLAFINVILVVFNLIPAFPMDGGRVFRALIWWATGNRARATAIASTVGQVIGYLFIFAGLWQAFFTGNVSGGIYLAFIGWFLQSAAGSTTRQTSVEDILRGVSVRNVMDQAPPMIHADMTVATLIDYHVLGQSQRVVPVSGPNSNLGGLVTLADVRDVAREEWTVTPVSRVMQPADRLCTVGADDDLADALRVLAEHRYHQLPVMEDGRMVGMLNRDHVLQYLHVRQRLSEMRGTDT